MKKPILMGVEGESREILSKAKCSIPFEPENSHDLVNKILEIKEKKSKLLELGQNGYDFVIENFDRSKIARDYLDSILRSS